jgi:hypothetical protein
MAQKHVDPVDTKHWVADSQQFDEEQDLDPH